MAERAGSTLQLETTGDGTETVVAVIGDVDAATAPQLLAVVESLSEDVKVIELDLTELGFLDSTGIGVVAAALRRLSAVDGTLRLRNVPPATLQLLRITDLLPLVEVVTGSG